MPLDGLPRGCPHFELLSDSLGQGKLHFEGGPLRRLIDAGVIVVHDEAVMFVLAPVNAGGGWPSRCS